jgi:undecaprenyl-diphosphatase
VKTNGILDYIDEVDKSLFLYLNNIHSPASDAIWQFITNIPSWIPLYLLLIILAVFRFKKDAFYVIIGISLVILFTDQFTSGFMKPFFGRLRPCHDPEIATLVHVVKGCGGKYSFASGHSANSFAIATFFWLIFRYRYRWLGLMFIWAAFVAYSRIKVGVHYPTDILAGALVGIFFGWLVYRILESIYFRLNLSPLIKD